MPSLRRTLSKTTMVMLGITMLTGVIAGAAQAKEPAGTAVSAGTDALQPGYVAIRGGGATATATVDGWFANIVFLDPSLNGLNVAANQWNIQSPAYLGPGGQTYRQIKFKNTNMCLSHMPIDQATEGLLILETCNGSNNSQWWAADHRYLYTPPCPGGGLPLCPSPVYADILMPWDASERAATVEGSLLVLRPRSGDNGSPEQRLTIGYVPAPPR